MTDSSIALSLKNVSYSYRHDWTGKVHHALKDITLDVRSGEAFGFLGHNGAGKTTAIKAILRITRPKRGTISIFGIDHSRPEARHHVGYLPEQLYFYDYLTVQEIMTLFASLAGVPRSERKQAVKEALERVKVSGRAKSPMRSLSKGLTQRVALAQAIVAKPKLLVLDEPFSGLDPIGRKEFRDLFFEMKQAGTTLFMSSHILSDVEYLCDRVSILARGDLKGVFDLRNISDLTSGTYELRIRGYQGIETVLKKNASSSHKDDLFLHLQFSDRIPAEEALRTTLATQGAAVEAFEFVKGNLEELFVNIVKFEEGSRG